MQKQDFMADWESRSQAGDDNASVISPNEHSHAPVQELPLEALPLREYYERYILPTLGPILSLTLKERPEDALSFVSEQFLRCSLGVRRQRIADRAARREAVVEAAKAEQQRKLEELEAEAAKPPKSPKK
jgi:hypothetical protein